MILIQLRSAVKSAEKRLLSEMISGLRGKYTEISISGKEFWVADIPGSLDIRLIGNLNMVEDVHFISDPYPLVSAQWRVNPTVIHLSGGVKIGGENGERIIAGPCSVESQDQIEKICAVLKEKGVKLMRGGIFKPRSSPYSFRGLGLEGLKMFFQIARKYDLRIVTEVMDKDQIEPMYPYVDVFQIGARNSQNFNLLDAIGKTDKPVLLKRGVSGTIEELLYSAEYIYSSGNPNIILCERGIRTFENAYRNCFDVNAVAILKEKSHLPVFADPSHGIGIRRLVPQIGLAALAAGADGVILEVHRQPEEAFSDGQQTLDFKEFSDFLHAAENLLSLRAGSLIS